MVQKCVSLRCTHYALEFNGNIYRGQLKSRTAVGCFAPSGLMFFDPFVTQGDAALCPGLICFGPVGAMSDGDSIS